MIVVGGECLVDLVESESEDGQTFLALPGGSPFNVALAAGRLGLPVAFLSQLSTDEFGTRLKRTLIESQVDLSLLAEVSSASTLAIAGLDPETKGARYMFYTEGTAGVGLSKESLPARLSVEVQAVHVGSFSLTMEPIASALKALVEREASERVISIDPNIRTMLMDDPEGARRRLKCLLAHADIIKLSDEDLEWLYPGLTAEAFARQALEHGAALVLLTKGSDGAWAWTGSHSLGVAAAEIEVSDSIGAGDTFMAATLCWLSRSELLDKKALPRLSTDHLRQLLSFASKAAGITCTRPGCDPPWLREVVSEGMLPE